MKIIPAVSQYAKELREYAHRNGTVLKCPKTF